MDVNCIWFVIRQLEGNVKKVLLTRYPKGQIQRRSGRVLGQLGPVWGRSKSVEKDDFSGFALKIVQSGVVTLTNEVMG